jgi:hypothetical protein
MEECVHRFLHIDDIVYKFRDIVYKFRDIVYKFRDIVYKFQSNNLLEGILGY